MKRKDWLAIHMLGVTVFVSGCSLFPTTRKLPVPKTPSITQTVSPEELVEQINKRWADLNNLTVKVEIQATLIKSKEGVITDFPSCTGYIVMAKPNSLRVAGTYFGVSLFDMASDGKTFTLVVPPKNKAIEGPNSVTKKSDNPLENLRPDFFFDAMVVRGLDPEDYYTMTADTETVEDAAKKHLYTEPEYVLSVTRHAPPGSRIDTPIRVVTFHRDDLLPYSQDLYDKNGNLESQVTYSLYQDFGGRKYPTKVIIKRPLEGIQLNLTVDWVHINVDLPADEFHVKIPDGIQIQKLD